MTVSVYLFGVRAGGALCELVNTSPIIGEVVVGALLGPPLADFVPNPLGLQLVGLLGIQLAVIEAGIVTDMDTFKKLAPRAFLIAVLGIILPIAFAILAVMGFGGTFLESFSAGAAIAPTSLGVVAKLLKEQNELDTPLGQIISMAAVFDDVLSLILLSFIQQLAEDDASDWDLASPIVFSFIFITVALGISSQLPKLVRPLLEKVPKEKQDYFALACLFLFSLLLTYTANLAGTSFLLGGYLAGIAFASVGEVIPNVYEAQVKRIMLWLARLFFAATIAFEIPLEKMFEPEALGLGVILGLIGVFGKMICGIGTYPNHMQDGVAVGVAMLGRGEFGFLIAAEASNLDLVTERQYAASVWGVVIPTLLTPILFGPIFRWRKRQMGDASVGKVDTSNEGTADENVSIHAEIKC